MMLRVGDLGKRYGRNWVFRHLDLQVDEGQRVFIMGPSGCGKSTLIRCINRLTEPEEGSVIFRAKDILKMNHSQLLDIRRQIGFVSQDINLVGRLTVVDNVKLPLIMRGLPDATAREAALESLSRVRLEHVQHKRPSELSGGEKQRAGIARALVINPVLMLWDEPTAALDPILVGEVLQVMEELVRETRTTMVIVTHEVSFAGKVADIIAFMDKGEIVETGPPEKVLVNPVSVVGRKYKELLAA